MTAALIAASSGLLPAPGLDRAHQPIHAAEADPTPPHTLLATRNRKESPPRKGGKNDDRPRYEVKKERIYYGDATRFKRPAVLSAQTVYESIPAYRSIVNRGLTKDDPEYWPLLRRAARIFLVALKAVCRDGKYDLVGELDSIQSPRTQVPDITELVVKAARG